MKLERALQAALSLRDGDGAALILVLDEPGPVVLNERQSKFVGA
jgi:hypothetical protein